MKKIYTGKTLEEMLATAATDKQCEVADLHYEIKEEKAGFLGLGKEITALVYNNQDIGEFIKTYLQTFFDGIEMQAYIEIELDSDGYYHVNLDTENNSIVIGRNGQTLQSLNTILRSAVSSEFKRRVGVLLDINGYKEEKYKKVCALARRVAKTVQHTKMDATLDPMPADERKAIHSYLTNMPGVSTVSEGEGKDRRLKIVYNPGKEVE